MKLRICGANLIGYDKPTPILELPETVKLRLSINGTRRARWWDKLGKQRKFPFTVNTNSIVANGGIIPCLSVVVQKQYPVLFYEEKLEKISEKEVKKTFVVRNEKEEQVATADHKTKAEKMIQQKQRELQDEFKQEEKERIQELRSSKKKKLTKQGFNFIFYFFLFFYYFFIILYLLF